MLTGFMSVIRQKLILLHLLPIAKQKQKNIINMIY